MEIIHKYESTTNRPSNSKNTTVYERVYRAFGAGVYRISFPK